jgi:hypothetical protein
VQRPALLVLALLALIAGATSRRSTAVTAACAPPRADSTYLQGVDAALRSRSDLWGNRLLATPGGPTYEGAKRFLAPLLYARGPGGRPLTASGVYYLPFAQPAGPQGAATVALHVADGSQIVWRRIGGRALTVSLGRDAAERYGSCLPRLSPARLAGGWQPILQTGYTDSAGARYRQESFAAGRPLDSFLRVHVDARRATTSVRLVFATQAGSLRVQVERGAERDVYVAWPGHGAPRKIPATGYASARAAVVQFWRDRLAEGAQIHVPEQRVDNAVRALLVQELVLTWRYSIGNPYEEFSFPEGVDVAQVLAELGFGAEARSILRTSFTRRPVPYPNWKKGERLLAAAEYSRLFADKAFLRSATPVLRGFVAELGRQIDADPRGLLGRERYSSDIPNEVYGLHSQAVVWEGLNAIGREWAAAGSPALAATCRRLAARLGAGLRAAVHASERRLPDGSVFLPVSLLDDERPYGTLTEARLGSYWNLVMPYALASGFFPPGSREAAGSLRYLLLHGGRLLGLVRAGGYALYGKAPPYPKSGTDEVYGINVARFLADEDEPDQLVLSLYGALAGALTPNTFVAGEGATVAPLADERDRAMYLPPNGAANAALLETLRLMLVHETRSADGAPTGLQVAYAIPRAWLAPGKKISATGLQTSFGTLGFSISSSTTFARVTFVVPDRPTPRHITLRLPLPGGKEVGGVTLGGRPYGRVDRSTGTIDLSGETGSLELVIRYRSRRSTP